MKKFSFRSIMIFVMCLVVAVLLIGLGIAGVIKFKHRDISNTSANEAQQPLQMSAGVRALRSRPAANGSSVISPT
jgi:Tfp pilus assembly protein PilV